MSCNLCLYIYEHKLSKCYTKRGMSGFKQILEKEHKNVYDHFILKSFKPHGIVVDNKLLNKCPFDNDEFNGLTRKRLYHAS